MSTAIEQESAPDFYRPDEYQVIEPVIDQIVPLPIWKVNRLFGLLMVAQYLEEKQKFDGTPRVFGADQAGNPIESPNYKIDTMGISAAEKEVHNQMRRAGTFIKGVHDKRKGWGRFLAATRIDEIPTALIYPLAGVHKFYGNTRPLLPAELESPQFYNALQIFGVTKAEFLSKIRVGVINVTQAYGVTEMITQADYDTLVMSVIIDPADPDYPSKTRMTVETAKDIVKKIGREIGRATSQVVQVVRTPTKNSPAETEELTASDILG